MNDVSFFWSEPQAILRIIVVGTLAYVSLVLLLRVSKRRVLARLNAFDFVVTVALGASFGRVLTARNVALVEAVTAFALLVILQITVAWAEKRSHRFADFVTMSPLLLYFRGRYLREAMRSERITEAEIDRVVRENGLGSLDLVEAIVLEPDGLFALVPKSSADDGSALQRVPSDG